jgi:hypothetical protein
MGSGMWRTPSRTQRCFRSIFGGDVTQFSPDAALIKACELAQLAECPSMTVDIFDTSRLSASS